MNFGTKFKERNLINARIETIVDTPFYNKLDDGIVLISGYYEWHEN